MKARPHQLLRPAQEGTYAIPGFVVDSIQKVRGVLKAADERKTPVVLHVGNDPGLWEGAAAEIQRSNEPAVLQFDFPTSAQDISRAFEAGIESFTIEPTKRHLSRQVRGRAGWVGAFFEKAVPRAGQQDIDAVHTTLPTTVGAFTGRHYIVFPALEKLLATNHVLGVHGAERVALSHVRLLASLPFSTIVFQVESSAGHEPTEDAIAALVVDKIRPLTP